MVQFMDDSHTKRLLVLLDGKDLSAVRAGGAGARRTTCAGPCTCRRHAHTAPFSRLRAQTIKPPPRFKRKAVYFLKLQEVKLDNENIKKLVRCCLFSAWAAR